LQGRCTECIRSNFIQSRLRTNLWWDKGALFLESGYVLVMFFVGFFAGEIYQSEWIKKYKVVMVLTMLLLFSLGLEIGANDELFKKIDSILPLLDF